MDRVHEEVHGPGVHVLYASGIYLQNGLDYKLHPECNISDPEITNWITFCGNSRSSREKNHRRLRPYVDHPIIT